ncbi:hypothetical protein NBO_85g0004 [Nosema bombycis CQ1]|uniref:Uncharacterized protein n=1 Tax=Nosema bombycis (strain CQ1 / CVCC 102059) TaxID=578461 RepID=R0MGM7_NOSB1|nr:hypothetical protein NBO_85g0004 [Nosema bombycis CQ1]|eukprot:EOB13275.1 hypothetical protein NBO_85g0004 [Nosema bombycis CQ1]
MKYTVISVFNLFLISNIPMKNPLFSKKYLKTKLCLLTVIMTLLYHLFSRVKCLFDTIKDSNLDYSIINEKKEKVLNNNSNDNVGNNNVSNNKDINKHNNNNRHTYINNDNFNLEIIPSDFLLDYWQSIKERKPSLSTPKISQGINSQGKFKKLDFSEFLESQILNDFIGFIKSDKYRKEGKTKRWAIARDLWVHLNVSKKLLTTLWDSIVGIPKWIINIFYYFRRI